jgi:penicillin-binding protein 1A
MDLQRSANQAVLDGLATYERRHGWRGHLDNVGSSLSEYENPDWQDDPEPAGYMHALVTATTASGSEIKIGRYNSVLTQADAAWTHRNLKDILKTGDIIYVKVLSLPSSGKLRVSLEEDSGAQGALIAIDNANGGIKAMVGGRDFNLSKFDRATQALRQAGSSFKPYVYTAAIDQGARPDDSRRSYNLPNCVGAVHAAQLRREISGDNYPPTGAGSIEKYPGFKTSRQAWH